MIKFQNFSIRKVLTKLINMMKTHNPKEFKQSNRVGIKVIWAHFHLLKNTNQLTESLEKCLQDWKNLLIWWKRKLMTGNSDLSSHCISTGTLSVPKIIQWYNRGKILVKVENRNQLSRLRKQNNKQYSRSRPFNRNLYWR
jgi:hypothetical protein